MFFKKIADVDKALIMEGFSDGLLKNNAVDNIGQFFINLLVPPTVISGVCKHYAMSPIAQFSDKNDAEKKWWSIDFVLSNDENLTKKWDAEKFDVNKLGNYKPDVYFNVRVTLMNKMIAPNSKVTVRDRFNNDPNATLYAKYLENLERYLVQNGGKVEIVDKNKI